ncbi:hypothetical protein J7337_004900 [Fusarium musae]|uniref:Uncharacterized protein n=1 Tax=Fusarium musae TaxID=1042133 RepID=A0A9P8IT66_9HYPO|nr:hypothetical protein J7337_004900 [Fusarium musae]KAG9504919.1 hypothetical protein J7337_004900 [Fusarium musae]
MPPPHRYLAVVQHQLPILLAAPVFGNHLVSESESPEQALHPLGRHPSRDAGDAVYTATLTITREQALTRVGDLLRQLQDASVDRKSFKPQMDLLMDFYTFWVLPRDIKMRERISTSGVVWDQEYTRISWVERLPGERIEMQDSDLAGPSLGVLADLFSQLPEKSLERARGIEALNNVKNVINLQQHFLDDRAKFAERPLQNHSPNTSPISDGALEKLDGTPKQLKETLVHVVKDKLEGQKSAPQEIVDDFKRLYILFRCDGLVIPCELHNLAAYSLSRDQHKEVLASRDDLEMAGG